MPRQTKTTKKMAETVREKKKEKAEPKELFKMKQFKNVASRTETRRHKNPNSEVQPQSEAVAIPPEKTEVANVAN